MADLMGEKLENETLSEEFFSQLMDKENLTEKWILIRSPFPTTGVLVIYLATIWAGTRIMRKKPAYQITSIMRFYNIFQVCFNVFLVASLFKNPRALATLIEKSCSYEITGNDLAELRYAYLAYSWYFLLSKIIDLLDTVFMVLRKKNSHITFLHVYHHAAMVFFTWVTLRYSKAVQGALPGLMNSAVHVIMYTYYFLATFGSTFEKYLWWKQHLTKIQLAQFAVILLYIIVLYCNGCPISKVFTYIWIFNMFVFMGLFTDFYVKEYIQKPKEHKSGANKLKYS